MMMICFGTFFSFALVCWCQFGHCDGAQCANFLQLLFKCYCNEVTPSASGPAEIRFERNRSVTRASGRGSRANGIQLIELIAHRFSG